MQVVCEATQASDSKTRVAAYECLVKITSLYYSKLAAWMQNIFNVSYLQRFSIFSALHFLSFVLTCSLIDYTRGNS